MNTIRTKLADWLKTLSDWIRPEGGGGPGGPGLPR